MRWVAVVTAALFLVATLIGPVPALAVAPPLVLRATANML